VSEAAIQKRAIAYAKKLGATPIRMVFRPGVTAGWPDVLFLFPNGVSVWVEFKAPGKKPSPLQQYRIRELRGLGQHVYVCDNFDTARETLTRVMEGSPLPG
jgi:hypothetical protein